MADYGGGLSVVSGTPLGVPVGDSKATVPDIKANNATSAPNNTVNCTGVNNTHPNCTNTTTTPMNCTGVNNTHPNCTNTTTPVNCTGVNITHPNCTSITVNCTGLNGNQANCTKNASKPSSLTMKNPTLNYVTIKGTEFDANIASIDGGAILYGLEGGKFDIIDTQFFNNFAGNRGGHLALQEGAAEVTVKDTGFEQTLGSIYSYDVDKAKIGKKEFIVADLTKSLVLDNITLDDISEGEITLLSLAGSNSSMSIKNSVSARCPAGEKLSIHTGPSNRIGPHDVISNVEFKCTYCPRGSYSFARGASTGRTVATMECNECPGMATCQGNEVYQRNYWLYEHNGQAELYPCPIGYCKNTTVCYGQRTGVLCSDCKTGYTEDLYSTACRPDSECKSTTNLGQGYIYWIAVAGLVLIYIIFFLNEADFSIYDIFIRREGVHRVSIMNKGFFKIAFFFYQVAYLIISNEYLGENLQMRIMHPVLGLFQFRVLMQDVEGVNLNCPLTGVTPMYKLLLHLATMYAIIIMLWLIYPFDLLISKCCYKRSRNEERKLLAKTSRYMAATVQVAVYGYFCLALTVLSNVNCLKMGNTYRVFYFASTECLASWQIAFLVVAGVSVLPFILAVWFVATRLQRRQITSCLATLMLVFPSLPFLILYAFVSCIASLLKKSHFMGRYPENEEPPAPKPQKVKGVRNKAFVYWDEYASKPKKEDANGDVRTINSMSGASIRSVTDWMHREDRNAEYILKFLTEPYHPPTTQTKGTLYWDSIYALRVLIMVAVYVFVTAPHYRLPALALGCIICLAHHTLCKPFRFNTANVAESISLTLLFCMAVCHSFLFILDAYHVERDKKYEKFSEYLAWVETGILCLPVAAFIVYLFFIFLNYILYILFVAIPKCLCGDCSCSCCKIPLKCCRCCNCCNKDGYAVNENGTIEMGEMTEN